MISLSCRLLLDKTLDSSTIFAIEETFTSLVQSIPDDEVESEVSMYRIPVVAACLLNLWILAARRSD